MKSFLHLQIWESNISAFTQQIFDGSRPVFAKPKDRKKRFTGRVFSHAGDTAYLYGISKKTILLCSEVVEWLSEYRVFIINGEIAGSKNYKGDTTIQPDEDVLKNAIHLLEKSGETTSAYALDFGVLSTGETALVEWNDGFSLGSYGLDRTVYTDLLITRWIELTENL